MGIVAHEPMPGCEYVEMVVGSVWPVVGRMVPPAVHYISVAQCYVLSRGTGCVVVGVCWRAHEYVRGLAVCRWRG